jgi:hypothetical protein
MSAGTEAAPQEGRTPGEAARDEARWEAFTALHPEAGLDRGCDWAHGRALRGRLSPELPWTGWAWSLERVLADLERMTGGGGTVHLWSAGTASGTAEGISAALGNAAPYLGDGAEALVEEAETALLPAGAAGLVPAYRHTGRAWRLKLEDGSPSWEPGAAEVA